jgi:hypothetical protein
MRRLGIDMPVLLGVRRSPATTWKTTAGPSIRPRIRYYAKDAFSGLRLMDRIVAENQGR